VLLTAKHYGAVVWTAERPMRAVAEGLKLCHGDLLDAIAMCQDAGLNIPNSTISNIEQEWNKIGSGQSRPHDWGSQDSVAKALQRRRRY
jgi:hypothetical protein